MITFSIHRVDDMLRNYGDKEVAAVVAAAEKTCTAATDYEISSARHRGECRAWVEHDAYFTWHRRLSNGFEELKQFVSSQDPDHTRSQITDWLSLRTVAADKAVRLLGRMEYPPCPEMLPETVRTAWWQLVAIVSECEYQAGAKWDSELNQ